MTERNCVTRLAAFSAITVTFALAACGNGCPSRPSDNQINTLFEQIRTKKMAEANSPNWATQIDMTHEKVDYVSQGSDCKTFTVHVAQYYSNGKKFDYPDLIASLGYASDGSWRLEYQGHVYKLE